MPRKSPRGPSWTQMCLRQPQTVRPVGRGGGGSRGPAETSSVREDQCQGGFIHFPFHFLASELIKISPQAVLEKLNDFLTENNLEQQIAEERKMIMQKIEGKNEEILQKKETHRHKLNEVHEAYKREIQKENERHLDDLKVGCID